MMTADRPTQGQGRAGQGGAEIKLKADMFLSTDQLYILARHCPSASCLCGSARVGLALLPCGAGGGGSLLGRGDAAAAAAAAAAAVAALQ